MVPATSPMALLDPTTLAWSEPKFNNPKVPNVAFHSATALTSKLMLVAFGKLFYFLKKICDILTYFFMYI